MANAGMRGRPIAPLVLSAQEQSYLERQVRRHRVAQSLSDRCRVILRCADGIASKDVAAEHVRIEGPGGRDVPHDQEVGHQDAVGWCGEVLEVELGLRVTHLSS